MDIIFFGSSYFSAPSLEVLIKQGYNVSCVVTQPDSKRGRGFILEGTHIKALAEKTKLKVYQPRDINTAESAVLFKSLNPDLFVVIAYGQILSRRILEIPKILPLNIHASLLPAYRGAAPINWAIINGDKITGVSAIKMTEKMDAGPVVLEKKIDIAPLDTVVTLEGKLSGLAAQLLPDAIRMIENNNYQLIPQDETRVSFAPKLAKKNGLIDWANPAEEIYNKIRGCLGWPGSFTHYGAKLLKMHKVKILGLQDYQQKRIPGEITEVSKAGIVVATGRGAIVIERLQLEGKRIMSAQEFIAGHKICVGDTLGMKK